jgi:hypothetical protein
MPLGTGQRTICIRSRSGQCTRCILAEAASVLDTVIACSVGMDGVLDVYTILVLQCTGCRHSRSRECTSIYSKIGVGSVSAVYIVGEGAVADV